ncbi:T9SS type A sorting domain-containing protein [Riemerella columbina]|uniref:T9SS type A sorting domain-containing protein n=1 Tax=Riemerella columbina TaxID=103810 RepID=UPI00266F991D|nr:T9SS type A sorting domain-containing protein [Riemerella columbina]WKS94908.1 T9SS type A sorting domain-containing protein [Riemerella columbina]
MKKQLLLLGSLGLISFSNAQLTTVTPNTTVYVTEGALLYSGGEVKTIGNGVIDNSGNIMINGGGFKTVNTNATAKTDGGNLILRITDKNVNALRYGQLYITGVAQTDVTGIVDKEYLDKKHGTYQQIALPFYQKNLADLNSEFSKTFEDKRYSQNEILYYKNAEVYAQNKGVTSQTTTNTMYFMLGAKDFDPSTTSVNGGVYVVKGVPYVDGITETLSGAGANIDFGPNGTKRNKYREKYNTYLQDNFAESDGEMWTGNYGKNIYQFGNPFLTNIDLGYLGKAIPNIRGVRLDPGGVITTGKGSTKATNALFITYDSSGRALGDVSEAVVRPMQTVVIKLKDNTEAQLDFDKLRSFLYQIRPENVSTVTGQSNRIDNKLQSFNKKISRASTVKQLGIIALDENGNKLSRSYFAVYNDAVTGKPKAGQVTAQVTTPPENIMGTYEENIDGGIDKSLEDKYLLYINEANENDFKGKEVALSIFSDKIRFFQFEIRENAKLLADNQSLLSSGEKFYIKAGEQFVEIKQGATIPVAVSDFGLYYGKPKVLKEDVVKVETSKNQVVYDEEAKVHKLYFGTAWTTAEVKVYDMLGRVVLSKDNVNTQEAFEIVLPKNNKAAYVVTAVSDKGENFSQKIVTK